MGQQPVTVLGLGPMGQALAGAFVDNGHPTTVWNRTPGKADALVSRGARRADTAAEAASASPLVIACVIDYDAVRAIIAPAAEELKVRTLVNLTADTPGRAREFADWAAERGIDYLDGSIMTPVPTIGGPQAVVLYSGPESSYQAHRATLASLGGTASYLGADPGRAAAYDVSLLDMFWTAMSGIVHGFALAKEEAIAAVELAPMAKGISGLLAGIIDDFATRIDEDSHTVDTSSVLSAAAGMAHIVHAAEARAIDTSVLSAARSVAQRAIDSGHGENGFSQLTQTLRPNH